MSVLRLLARHEEVVRLATPVLARTGDCGHAARMAWSLGRSLQALGRMDEALDVVSDALDRLEDSPSWRARLRGVRAEIMIVCGRPEGVEEAERAVAEADETGDSYAAAYALHALCMANHPVGSPHSGLAVTRRALTLASDDPEFTEVRLMLLRERVRAL